MNLKGDYMDIEILAIILGIILAFILLYKMPNLFCSTCDSDIPNRIKNLEEYKKG